MYQFNLQASKPKRTSESNIGKYIHKDFIDRFDCHYRCKNIYLDLVGLFVSSPRGYSWCIRSRELNVNRRTPYAYPVSTHFLLIWYI